MKVCTITCHDVYNHGASLQAYALIEYLKQIGNDVEIIDYKPDYLSGHYKIISIDNPKWNKNYITKLTYIILKLPFKLEALKRKKAFDTFKNKFMSLSKYRYTSNIQLINNIPKADVYLCGSDQIWNSLRDNGKDPAFYLDFVPDSKIRASYAASFATETIDNKYKNFVRENLLKLDRISVREKSGKKIINELELKKVEVVVDPVFLLDRKIWDDIGNTEFKDKYVLVYDFDNNPIIKKLALEISHYRRCKIYTINHYRGSYEDKNFKFSGPETFISLVRNAEFVISNSFHAVAFSLIYKKPMAIVRRLENINTRMRDLLIDFNLEHRYIENDYILDKLLEDIDYAKVDKILKAKIISSKNYINEVLSIKK